MPINKEVRVLYDGASRMYIDRVWLNKRKEIIISNKYEVIYYDEDKPLN